MRVQEGDRLFDESDGTEKPADIIATTGLYGCRQRLLSLVLSNKHEVIIMDDSAGR